MVTKNEKEVSSDFYRKLYLVQEFTDKEFKAAARRLKIVRQRFMKKFNLVEDQQVPGPLDFIGDYIGDKWFLEQKEILEKLSLNFLLGTIDLEFTAYLKSWWDQSVRFRVPVWMRL
jgi:hypothetical protein